MNKKGFTLVELLVTIAILGIISGLSIPVIRNINQQRINKRYSTYLDSLSYASKLYTDSYAVDMFGHSTTGCAYITFDDLKEKNLAKDIEMEGISCATPYTAVKVVRFKEKYYYKTFIGCGKKSGTIDPNVFMPKKLEQSELCDDELSANITFRATNPASSTDITKKKLSPRVVMESITGVSFAPAPIIKYGYSYENDGTHIIGDWQNLEFESMKESLQTRLIENGDPQSFNAKEKSPTPDGRITGKLNLVIRVDLLENLEHKNWRTIENSEVDNYVILGPFLVDNSAPLYRNSTIISKTGTSYQSRIPQLNFEIIDNIGYSVANADFKYCYTYDDETACPIINSASALNESSKYRTYNPHADLREISNKYDGSSHTIHVIISDAAGNTSQKDFSYRVANTYKLTFNPDGGSACNVTSIGQIEGKKWNEAVVNEEGLNKHDFCTTTKAGYDLNGWYTGKNGTGTQVKPTDAAQSNLTVYAKWKPKTVKVTFDCNGGSGGGDQTFTYGAGTQNFGKTCSRTGYTLAGWKDSKTGTSTNYATTYAVTDSWINSNSPTKTVYAHWVPKTVKVTFNCNGGSGGGDQTFTYGTSGQKFSKTCTKAGHTLSGWKDSTSGTSANYATAYAVPDAWINSNSPSKTVYAHWVLNSYTLTFNANGGSACSPASRSVNYGAKYGTLCSTSRTGYNFLGWYTEASAGSQVTENTTMTEGNKTIYAHWQIKTYTLSYNGNGNTGGSTAATTCNHGQACSTATNGFTKTGYSFDGWYDAASGGTKYTSVTLTANKTLYAHWKINSYTITYAGNGSTGGSTAATSCNYNATCTLRGNGFTKTGHTFAGWYTAASGGSKYGASTTLTGNITVYAHWTANTYTVTYKGNGNTGGSTAATTCTYGKAFTPRANGFTKSHYHFNGWSGSTTCSGNMTMTATWAVNHATVRYHTGTSSGSKLKYKPSGWSIKSNYQIWNATTQDIQIVNYGTSADPLNYHNSDYLYIMKTSSSNGTAYSGKEWEKCDGSSCARSTYNQNTDYTSEQYCNTTNGNCVCCIKVNWK